MEFDWVTFALEIVNFLVLVWILKRFLYQPVMGAIARRKAAIEKTLEAAKARQAEAEALQTRYRGRLDDWEQEKQAHRAKAEEALGAERERGMAALRAALEDEREKHRARVQSEMDEWRDRLEREAMRQGVRFAARLLARLATPVLEARLVAVALEDLDRLPSEQLEAVQAACREGNNRLRVTTAHALAARERDALVQGFSKAAGAGLAAEFTEDAGLLAGLRASIGPWVMHANLQDELAWFAGGARDGA